MKRKFVALMALGLMTGALAVPTTAQAGTFAGILGVDCPLPEFPTGGIDTTRSVTCSGPATLPTGTPLPFGGIGVGATPPEAGLVNVTVNANYSEPCVVAAGFPVVGLATGTIQAGSQAPSNFQWVRVGVTAVIVPVVNGSTTAGVGILIPHTPIGDCGNHLPTTVTVLGAGLAA